MIQIFCPCCGQHWTVDGAMGQWLASCVRCEIECEICWDHLACESAVLQECSHQIASKPEGA